MGNQFYFQRRPLVVTGVFCSLYAATSYNALSWDNQILRMGVAGSISTILCDSAFHFVDTVNIRAKAA